ncbi:MAG: tRNA (adenosine(37)-N6)-threonylcarbamoyltransferase complex dimerization subunit type 1 TsaB [Elusimicrobiota bacterium]|jgi:tRNA threonylcarbamoyl adenosine modification protein YeaZ
MKTPRAHRRPKSFDAVLAVDTTEDTLSAALLSGGRVLRSSVKAGRGHERLLFTAVDRLLKKAGLKMEDLSALAASSGPGRFTGIRVGMTFCCVAASRLGVRAVAVNRLAALAFGCAAACREAGAKRLAAVIPGWKDEKFYQLFTAGPRPRPAGAPVWATAEGWLQALPAIKDSGAFVVEAVPGATEVLALAVELLGRGRLPAFEPLYLKPAGYELKKGQA